MGTAGQRRLLAVNDPLGHFEGYCVALATGVWPTVWEFTWVTGAS